MPSVSTRVGEVSYFLQGKGIPIVLLHATLHDHHDYDSIATKLAERYQTIAVDWPWHGESQLSSAYSNKLPTAMLLADVLEDIVSNLKLPPAIFIGNSVGGFSAARLAIAHPERVRALILVNSGGFTPLDISTRIFCHVLGFQTMARFIMPYLVPRYMVPQTPEDQAILEKARGRARTDEGSAIVASLFHSFINPEHDLRGRASKIKAPTLLAWGMRDVVISLSTGQEAQRLINDSKYHPFETGHVVFSSRPEEFLTVVEPFIDSVVSQGENATT